MSADYFTTRKNMLFRRLRSFALISMAAGLPNLAQASAFESLDALNQENFEILVENLSAATQYRGVTPTEPLGIIGFDVGVSLTATEIDEDIVDLASDGDFDFGQILIPKFHIHKGLPFGFDIGGLVSAVPETDITLLGAELRKAIFEGSAGTPAVGIRLGYSTVQGLEQLEMDSLSLDISISKDVLLFTPYAGLGVVVTRAEASEEFGLDEVTVNQEKAYVGLNINLGVNVTLEADRTGDFTSFSAKAGFRF